MNDVDYDHDDANPEHRRGKKSGAPKQYIFTTSTKNAEQLSDPVKCALCSRLLQCPRGKDYEEFMERKNIKCMTSEDPICVKASRNPSNRPYIDRLKSLKKP